MNVYSVKNLVKRYEKTNVLANDNISFELKQGDIFGLLGPNGAGKTTFLRQLMGLLRPSSGEIYLYGKDVVANPDIIPPVVSYMSQRPLALADLKVIEAMTITGHLRGMTRANARKQGLELIEEFGLEEISSRILGRLSGGQLRLISFCLALLNKLPVLILDEPTNDIDPAYRKKLWQKLQEINIQEGVSIILVTHNVTEAEKVLKSVGIINHGKVVAMGCVEELKEKIARDVRLEIIFKPDSIDEETQEELFRIHIEGMVKKINPEHWMLHVPKEKAMNKVQAVVNQIGVENLHDFRILMPNLEDVYLELGGGKRLAKTG